MKEQLLNLIDLENKKRPYTDSELAKILKVTRSDITSLRREYKIQNSRDRRKPLLKKTLEKIITKDNNLTDRDLTIQINNMGFDVSRFLINQLRKEIKGKLTDNAFKKEKDTALASQKEANYSRSKITSYNSKTKKTATFSGYIGADNSLKHQVQQSKAAVLYPPRGLHTLILGPTGSGKSFLAEAMYNFAIETGNLPPEAKFVVFNCADYADNPQFLLTQLFGYVKGAYTGAETSKEGMVEQANGGILFLDEVHRLPPEGQELLFYLIDKGKYRRMGETESSRSVNLMIIAATSTDIEASLLLTFRRRIPMLITLPPLAERPISEKYEMIKEFLIIEADRIGAKLKISQEALRTLLLYDCPGNAGQLRSDIQVACARGFLSYVSGEIETVNIDLIDLPLYARRGMLKLQNRNPNVAKLIKEDLVVSPEDSKKVPLQIKENPQDIYVLPQEIYQYIEEKYVELRAEGVSEEAINRIIGGELEIKFQQLIKQFEINNQIITKENLTNIVGQEIIDMAEQMVKIAKKKLVRVDNRLLCYLSIHLRATVDRIRKGRPIINPRYKEVKNKYKFEYKIAEEMVKVVERVVGKQLPEDEISFIAMYLRSVSHPEEPKQGKVGVIILTHGHVAQAMADVANRLLGINHVKAVEMSLDETPATALERAIEMVQQVDEGKGVLLLVDMGSLITFGEIITKRTHIPTKTIRRVDIIKVLDAARRAILPDTDLNKIVDSIDKDFMEHGRLIHYEGMEKKKAIVALCITGEGTAIKIKSLLEKMIPEINDKAEIIPFGIIGNEDIETKIKKIQEKKEVVALVGTIEPENLNIPFIPLEEIINRVATDKLMRILFSEQAPFVPLVKKPKSSLKNVIYQDLIIADCDYATKDEVLEGLAKLLINKGFVKEKFLLDVYKREIATPTLMENGVSIPHGTSTNVIKQAIAIAIFKEPISWAKEGVVDIVFMLALKKNSEQIICGLYNLINDREVLSELRVLQNSKEIKEVLINYI